MVLVRASTVKKFFIPLLCATGLSSASPSLAQESFSQLDLCEIYGYFLVNRELLLAEMVHVHSANLGLAHAFSGNEDKVVGWKSEDCVAKRGAAATLKSNASNSNKEKLTDIALKAGAFRSEVARQLMKGIDVPIEP